MLEKAELTLIIMLSKTKKVITTHLIVLCSVASRKLFYSIAWRVGTLSLQFVPPAEGGGMEIIMQIIPMRALKDTVDIERRCSEENGPVFVTKNDYGRLVVMDIEYYERTIRKIYEAKMIIEGIEDVKKGRVSDSKSVIDNIRSRYGL